MALLLSKVTNKNLKKVQERTLQILYDDCKFVYTTQLRNQENLQSEAATGGVL